MTSASAADGSRFIAAAPIVEPVSNPVQSLLSAGPTQRVRAISVRRLVDAYRAEHKFDVSKFLPAIDEIEVYRCLDTGLEFFFPLDLSGSPEFYEALYSSEGADWAYSDGKWEFETALRFVEEGQTVLDIGCGGGAFLERARGLGALPVGLETSPLGRSAALKRGLNIFDETIVAHAAKNLDRYDFVSAFQVLEHVSDPAAFLKAASDVVKPGGILLISVPNNDSFLKHCELLPLNAPPHHVTLWNRRSLESLLRFFPLDLVAIQTEPLQLQNLDWYQSVIESRHLPKLRIARLIYYRLGGQAFFKSYLAGNRENIDGHTIMAAYRKRAPSAAE